MSTMRAVAADIMKVMSISTMKSITMSMVRVVAAVITKVTSITTMKSITMSMVRVVAVDIMKVMNIITMTDTIMSMARVVAAVITITTPMRFLKAGVGSRSKDLADKNLKIYLKSFQKAVSTVWFSELRV